MILPDLSGTKKSEEGGAAALFATLKTGNVIIVKNMILDTRFLILDTKCVISVRFVNTANSVYYGSSGVENQILRLMTV